MTLTNGPQKDPNSENYVLIYLEQASYLNEENKSDAGSGSCFSTLVAQEKPAPNPRSELRV